jgi:hypothetical protein
VARTMRANEFVFKKTKRTVTKHHALCLDLTVDDCRDLMAIIDEGYSDVYIDDSELAELESNEVLAKSVYDRLAAFVKKHTTAKKTA